MAAGAVIGSWALAGTAGSQTGGAPPIQHVAAGQVVFGCVLRPAPPKQRLGPPAVTATATIRCAQTQTRNRILLLVQQYIAPRPGETSGSWGNAVRPLDATSTPIPANRTVTASGRLPLDCNPNDAVGYLGTPGTYRTEIRLLITVGKRPARSRDLAADSSSVPISCS